jgi:hypothetical protein
MPNHVRMRPIACAAIVALLVIAGNGSARRFSFEAQNFRIVWNPMTFRSSTPAEIRCRVTLGGTWVAAELAKVTNSIMGRITEAAAEGCQQIITFLGETLPWEVRYRDFIGTLPRIQQIETEFRNMHILLRSGLFGCLFISTIGSEVTANWAFEGMAERPHLVILVNTNSEPIRSEGCIERTLRLEGTGRPTIRGGETFFQVFLI